MYCKNCGEEIDDKAAICIKCGVYTEEKKKKNVTFAFIWSFLIAGAGQCYNGEWSKGTLMFVGCEIFGLFVLCITSLFMPRVLLFSTIGFILVLIVWIVSMIDAVSVAQKINKGD